MPSAKLSDSGPVEMTYPLRAAARLTGLSPEVLRAWERRYGVVTPVRTAGGTRRYRASDLERLRRVKAAVDAGHRIGEVARLAPAELERRAARGEARATAGLDAIFHALESLDAAEAQRRLSLQLSVLGPARFAREIALPLVHEVGERWAAGRLGIAAEHVASSVLRSLLGAALQPTAASLLAPRVVFATPSGERHELGLLMAALTALGAGASPLHLGVELPVADLIAAVEVSGAAALALGIVTLPAAEAQRLVGALRAGLPEDVPLWLGGPGARGLALLDGMEFFDSLERLEQRVALLAAETHA